MKNKKNMLIILLCVAVIISIILAILYITTDLFKSNEYLFKKYLLKTEIIDKEYLSTIREYNKKIINNNNSSTANFEICNSNINTEEKNIILSTKIDSLKNVSLDQDYKVFRISNSTQELAVLKLVRDGNIIAVGADNILTKYISIENNNLKNFSKRLGVTNTEKIPNSIKSIDLKDLINISDEDKDSLYEKYIEIILNNLTKDMYGKTKNNDSTKNVSISLAKETIDNILNDILKEIQNDETTINLIKEKAKMLGYELNNEDIITDLNTYKTTIENNLLNNFSKLKISLTVKDSEVTKILFEVFTTEETSLYNFEINLKEKNKIIFTLLYNNKAIYNIEMQYSYTDADIILETKVSTNNEEKMSFNYEVNNYNNDNIKEMICAEFNQDSQTKLICNFNNNITIKQDVQIEKLTTENSVRIDNFDDNQLQSLIKALNSRILTLYYTN